MVVKESSIPILPLVKKSTDDVGMSKTDLPMRAVVRMTNIRKNH